MWVGGAGRAGAAGRGDVGGAAGACGRGAGTGKSTNTSVRVEQDLMPRCSTRVKVLVQYIAV